MKSSKHLARYFEYDLYYIRNLAVSLDMYIIFHTMKVMFFQTPGSNKATCTEL
jgi:lipopolysaccharide/colanic/teichoic acid biosynthesis glycosyltransferase